MDRQTDGETDGWADGRMRGCVSPDGWTDGRMDGRTNTHMSLSYRTISQFGDAMGMTYTIVDNTLKTTASKSITNIGGEVFL